MHKIVAFVINHQFFGANSQDRKRCAGHSPAGHAKAVKPEIPTNACRVLKHNSGE
jgi:hypothetical protein